jgi:transcriptional regulator with XRE-family HTH domain
MSGNLADDRERQDRAAVELAVGKRIEKLRTESGVSRKELAEQLGYRSASTVFKIENGVGSCPAAVIVRICALLGVESKDILGV